MHFCKCAMHRGLDPDPLRPPPSLLEIGGEVPDCQRQMHHKEHLLDAAKGEKVVCHTMCLYSDFSGELNSG